ncbi:hypothetical protein FRB96_001528 [Tulasnella sp. 330]|nr:hypothetical protein FRB96_001528 [Tulasnella sp. 330]
MSLSSQAPAAVSIVVDFDRFRSPDQQRQKQALAPIYPRNDHCSALARPVEAQLPILHLSSSDIEKVESRPISGGYCDLFQGVYAPTGLKVALKRLKSAVRFDWAEEEANARRRIHREEKIWANLTHRNILPFYGLIEMSNETYLVSPWMELGDLHMFIVARLHFLDGTPESQESDPKHDQFFMFNERDVICGIASGIVYLHTLHIVHGDLKAKNVLLNADLSPLLCDFGMTKALDEEYNTTSPAIKGAGTRRWMSPELLLQGGVKTMMSDIYAFGMTVVEILTGKIPFSDHDLPTEYIFLHGLANGIRPTPSPLSRLGQDFEPFWNLASRCWLTEPHLRPSAIDITQILGLNEPSESHGLGLLGLESSLTDSPRVCDGILDTLEVDRPSHPLELATDSVPEGHGGLEGKQEDNIFAFDRHIETELARERPAASGDLRRRASLLQGCGEAFRNAHRYTEAQKQLEEALRLHQQLGNDLGIARCLWNLGDVYRLEARYDEAHSTLKRAVEAFQPLQDPLEKAHCLWSLGDVYWRQDMADDAAVTWGQALEVYRQLDDSVGIAECSRNLGHVYQAQSRFEDSQRMLLEALAIFGARGMHRRVQQCSELLASLPSRHPVTDRFLSPANTMLNQASQSDGTHRSFLVILSILVLLPLAAKLQAATTAMYPPVTGELEIHQFEAVYSGSAKVGLSRAASTTNTTFDQAQQLDRRLDLEARNPSGSVCFSWSMQFDISHSLQGPIPGTSNVVTIQNLDRYRSPDDQQGQQALTPIHAGNSAYLSALAQPSQAQIPVLQVSSNDVEEIESRPIRGGHYCDLFQGVYAPSGLKLALKRPKFSARFDTAEEEASARRRIQREERIWANLTHRNILPFYGLIEKSNDTYLVSPWMELGDLHLFVMARLRFLDAAPERQDLDPKHDQFLMFNERDVICGIVSGVAYLHSLGIVHGDLKAKNVLLNVDLSPLLCDFGLTKVLDGEYSATSSAMKGAGTTRWMGPELLLHDGVKTRMSDIYAFGMSIFEILTGKVPFWDLNDYHLLSALGKGLRPNPSPSSRLTQDFTSLWELASRCWGNDPYLRPSADEVMQSLGSNNSGEAHGLGLFGARSSLSLSPRVIHQSIDLGDKPQDHAEHTLNPAVISTGVGHGGMGGDRRDGTSNGQIEGELDHHGPMVSEDLRRKASLLQGRGEAFRNAHRYTEAQKQLEEALQLHQQLGNDLGIARCLWNIGDVYRLEARYDDARSTLKQAVEAFQPLQDPLGKAHCLWSLGDAYWRQGLTDDAEVTWGQALEVYRQLDDGVGIAECSRNLGRVYQAQSRFEDSQRMLLEALTIFGARGMHRRVQQCSELLASLPANRHPVTDRFPSPTNTMFT